MRTETEEISIAILKAEFALKTMEELRLKVFDLEVSNAEILRAAEQAVVKETCHCESYRMLLNLLMQPPSEITERTKKMMCTVGSLSVVEILLETARLAGPPPVAVLETLKTALKEQLEKI